MKLTDMFLQAIRHAKKLVTLHDLLLTGNERGIRKDWADSFYKAHLVNWPQKAGLWRSRNPIILIVGRADTGFSHDIFSADSHCILLRSALVLSLAAVDKILHEAISKHFVALTKNRALDDLVDLKLSKAYAIAQGARRRKGKGGKVKSRPGHKIKAEVLTQVYGDTYLSIRRLQQVAAALGKDKIFTRFSKTLNPSEQPQVLQDRWSRIYLRRNQIAHECDIVRKAKQKKTHFHSVHPQQMKDDISFAEQFGTFLARELE
jgi:hypothetical protein